MTEQYIFVMDSDLCPHCDALLEYDQCIECGYGWLWFFGEDDPFTDFGYEEEEAYWIGEYDDEEEDHGLPTDAEIKG